MMSSADIIESTSLDGTSTYDRRHEQRSPMSAGHLNASTVSMRAKAQRKRKANQQHNSNFKAGYVPIDEDVLNRTGIRGRKRFFLYCVLIFLLIIALLNVAVTVWLLYILGMTHNGMWSVELTSVHGRDFLRVLADAKIISLSFKEDGSLGARYNSSLKLEAVDTKVQIKVGEESDDSVLGLTFDSRNLTIVADSVPGFTLEGGNLTAVADEFIVNTGWTRSEPLSLDLQTLIDHGQVPNLIADNVTAPKIKSEDDDELILESMVENVKVSGVGGVNISSSKGDIVLKVQAESSDDQTLIRLDSERLYLKDLPLSSHVQQKPNVKSYKVCVCKNGILFTVPVSSSNQRTSCSDRVSLCR